MNTQAVQFLPEVTVQLSLAINGWIFILLAVVVVSLIGFVRHMLRRGRDG